MTLDELKKSCDGWTPDAYGALYFAMDGLDLDTRKRLGLEIIKELERVYSNKPKTLDSMKQFFKINLDL